MTRWLPGAASTNLTIRAARPSDAAALARVYVDSWRETYSGILADSYLHNLSYAHEETLWRHRIVTDHCTFLGVCRGQIVGLASGGRCRWSNALRGELHLLYVLRGYQRMGIGRALFDAVHFSLATQGYGQLSVWVLEANNNAREFYERVGGQLLRSTVSQVGAQRLRQIAYEWPE